MIAWGCQVGYTTNCTTTGLRYATEEKYSKPAGWYCSF